MVIFLKSLVEEGHVLSGRGERHSWAPQIKHRCSLHAEAKYESWVAPQPGRCFGCRMRPVTWEGGDSELGEAGRGFCLFTFSSLENTFLFSICFSFDDVNWTCFQHLLPTWISSLGWISSLDIFWSVGLSFFKIWPKFLLCFRLNLKIYLDRYIEVFVGWSYYKYLLRCCDLFTVVGFFF